MDSKNQPPKAPEAPEWFITTVVKSIVSHAAIFAAIYAISSKIPGLNKLWNRTAKEEAINGAMTGTVVGGIVGAMQGAANHAAHPLHVENTHLRHHVKELKEDKSFAQQALQEKLESTRERV